MTIKGGGPKLCERTVFSCAMSLTHTFVSFSIQNVQTFLLQVSDNRLARALFQLAICGGSLAVPPDLVPKDKASKTSEQTKTEDKPTTSLPSEGIHE